MNKANCSACNDEGVLTTHEGEVIGPCEGCPGVRYVRSDDGHILWSLNADAESLTCVQRWDELGHEWRGVFGEDSAAVTLDRIRAWQSLLPSSALPDSAPTASSLPPAAERLTELEREMAKQASLGHRMFCVGIHVHEGGEQEAEWIEWPEAFAMLRASEARGPHSPARVVETAGARAEAITAQRERIREAWADVDEWSIHTDGDHQAWIAAASRLWREIDALTLIARRYDALSRAAVQQEGATDAGTVGNLVERIEVLSDEDMGHLLDVWSGEVSGNWRQELLLRLTTESERYTGRLESRTPSAGRVAGDDR